MEREPTLAQVLHVSITDLVAVVAAARRRAIHESVVKRTSPTGTMMKRGSSTAVRCRIEVVSERRCMSPSVIWDGRIGSLHQMGMLHSIVSVNALSHYHRP